MIFSPTCQTFIDERHCFDGYYAVDDDTLMPLCHIDAVAATAFRHYAFIFLPMPLRITITLCH